MHALRIFRLARFRSVYAFRGLAVWTLLRMAGYSAGMVGSGPLQLTFILCVVALAVFLDARRREETIFLGNLGVPAFAVALPALPLPILIELTVL